MDKNTIKGTEHEIKGAIKEVIGHVTGDKAKEVAGNVEKNLGTVQKEAGKATDAIKDAAKAG